MTTQVLTQNMDCEPITGVYEDSHKFGINSEGDVVFVIPEAKTWSEVTLNGLKLDDYIGSKLVQSKSKTVFGNKLWNMCEPMYTQHISPEKRRLSRFRKGRGDRVNEQCCEACTQPAQIKVIVKGYRGVYCPWCCPKKCDLLGCNSTEPMEDIINIEIKKYHHSAGRLKVVRKRICNYCHDNNYCPVCDNFTTFSNMLGNKYCHKCDTAWTRVKRTYCVDV